MTQYLVVTQAPHLSYLNGGTAATAHQPFLRYTQRTPNGPRIASAISGMSPGDFATVWADATGDIFTVRLPSTGATYNTRDWTPHGVWDATTEQALFGGRRGLTKLTAYSDVTGDWRELQQPADLGRSVNGTVHYYGLIAKDGSGNVYFGNVESLGRTWQFDPVTEEYTRLPDTPTTNGGNGASLSWCADTGRLARYAGDAQKWMTLEPGVDSSWTTHTTGVGHGAHAIVRYHATHARHLIVGGTSTSTRASLITSDGTVTNVTDVPDTISMADGSWVAEHPDGCWLVKTMNAGTDKVYACWPNAGLTDVTWVDLGTAPDTALTYPTLVPYTSSVALIASTTGLYAWALPAVTDPSGGASATPANGGATASALARALSVSAMSVAVAAASVSATGASQAAASATAAVGAASVSVVGISFAAAAAASADGAATASATARSNAQASATAADGVASVSAVGTSVGSGTALFTPAAGAAAVSAVGASTAAATASAAAGAATCSAVGSSSDGTTYATPSAATGAASVSAVGASQAVAAITAAAGVATVSAISGGAQPLSAPPAKQRLQSSSRGANLQTSRRPLYRGGSR